MVRGGLLALGVAMVAGGLAAPAEGLAPGTTVLVTRDGAGTHASGGTHYSAVSTAGKCVAFDSDSTALPGATGGKRQIYVRDIDAGTTELVSVSGGGTGTAGGDGHSYFPVITPDCRYVAFDSDATNLTAGTQTQRQVYRRDLQTDATILISRATGAGAASDRGSAVPSISDDGNRVSFTGTSSNLASDDSDGILHDDVFVRKVTEAETMLVSRNDADAAQDALGEATGYTDISGDGSKVGFDSTAHNLSTEDADNGSVFIRDIDAGTTLLASRSGGPTGPAADGPSGTASLNGDGNKVLFQTSASNLGASGTVVIVVRDVTTGATQIVSRASGATGALSNSSTGGSGAQILSSDGTRAAFWSFASNLDPAATTTGSRVYVRDLTTATTALQTPPPVNTAPEIGFAPDGSAVSFMTVAQLSADDTDSVTSGTDIYARGVSFTAFVPPNPNPNPPGPDPDPDPTPAVVTPTPTPTSTVLVADLIAPTFTAISVSNGIFAVDPSGAAEVSVARTKPRKGTTFRYTLSEAARVVFTIDRSSIGRKVGTKCVKQTSSNRKRKKCTLFTRAGRFAASSAAGANEHAFSGKIGPKALTPGSYRTVLVATDAAGNASAAKLVTFKVVRP